MTIGPSFQFGFDVKDLFLDRPRVVREVDRARRRALSRSGGYVRRIAMRSMRKRRGPSAPGQPPHAHEGGLRRNVYFAYEPRRESVWVGPVAYPNSRVPRLLEYGGTVRVPMYLTPWGELIPPHRAHTLRAKRVRLKPSSMRVRIAPRPYMRPALRASEAVIRENFREMLTK